MRARNFALKIQLWWQKCLHYRQLLCQVLKLSQWVLKSSPTPQRRRLFGTHVSRCLRFYHELQLQHSPPRCRGYGR
jgi:hypothetical protein